MAGHEHATERGQSANLGGDGAAHTPPLQESSTSPLVELSSLSSTQALRSDAGEDSSQSLASLGSDISGMDSSSPAIGSKPSVQESSSSQHCENENEIEAVDVDGGSPPAGSEQKYREEWEGAKERKDCKKLIELMKKEDFDFWQYENEKLDRTALHVAAMQGCLRLVKLILEKIPYVHIDESSSIFRIDRSSFNTASKYFIYTAALDKQSQLSAFEMANDIIGNKSISRLMISVDAGAHRFWSRIEPWSCDAKLFPASPLSKWYAAMSERHCNRLKELLQWDSRFVLENVNGVSVLHLGILENNAELVNAVVKLFGPEKRIVWGESYYPPSLQLEDILHVKALTYRRKSLKKDLGRKRWTAFIHHYEDSIALAKALNHDAIAQLLKTSSIQTSAILSDQIESGGKSGMKDLLQTWISILNRKLDVLCSDCITLIMEYVVDKAIEDARGRRLFDIYLLKNFTQNNILLGANLADDVFDSLNFKNFVQGLMFIQYMLCLTQTNLVEICLLGYIEAVEKRHFKWRTKYSLLLFIAALTGNQTILQLLLEQGFDPMIVDNEGRTLLHHAIDSTLLSDEKDHLLFSKYCPTIDDHFEVKSKWNNEYNQKKGDKWILSSPVLNDTYKMKDNSTTEKKIVDLNDKLNVGRQACILMLLQAGVDLSQTDKTGRVPTIGPTNDATYQKWWYELTVKDTTHKKNSFNQAGNALSVVGTLVASTSYIGPLQPPMNYIDGFVNISEKLVKVFMVSNTLAFYLAMASVMFAVVPSLPMPQESVMTELNRARRMVSLSLCLLLGAIRLIIISFACASMVVVQDEQSFKREDLLFVPSIIGWIFCLVAIIGFLIRIMRLMFYNSSIVRRVYQISFWNFLFTSIAYVFLLPFFSILMLLMKIGGYSLEFKIDDWLESFEFVESRFENFRRFFQKIREKMMKYMI